MPAFIARHGAVLHDFDFIANTALIVGIMSRELAAAPDILLKQRMFDERFNTNNNGLVVLVTDHKTGQHSALFLC